MPYVQNQYGQTVFIDPNTNVPVPGYAQPGNSLTYAQNIAAGAFPINAATGAAQQGQASLTPPTMRRLAQAPGVTFYQTPCAYPTPFLAYNEENTIGRQIRDYSQKWIWGTDFSSVGTEVPKSIRWDTVGAVYALCASVYMNTGTVVPTSVENIRDTFLVSISQPNGNLYITNTNGPALGSTVFGNAERPRWLANSAWPINNGTTLQIGITPLFANMNVYVNFWTIENPGPSNIDFYPGR